MKRGLLHAVWPVAILILFVGAFRRSAPDARMSGDGAPCDRPVDHAAAATPGRLERCLESAPGDVETMIELAALVEESADAERAESLYRRALTVDPRDARIHVRLGRLLLARGDRAGAAREAGLALQAHPGNDAAIRLVEEARPR